LYPIIELAHMNVGIRYITVVFLAFFGAYPLSVLSFDYKGGYLPIVGGWDMLQSYETYLGDYNGDGFKDLYVRGKPKLGVMEGIDNATRPSKGVKPFVLQQDVSIGGFQIVESNVKDLHNWKAVNGIQSFLDLNADGVLDMAISNLEGHIDNVGNYIVIADENPGEYPVRVDQLTKPFSVFGRDFQAVYVNKNYFWKNAIKMVKTPAVAHVLIVEDRYCRNVRGVENCYTRSSDASIISLVSVDRILGADSPLALAQALPAVGDPNLVSAIGVILEGDLGELIDFGEKQFCISRCLIRDGLVDSSGGWARVLVYDMFFPYEEELNIFDKGKYSIAAAFAWEEYSKIDVEDIYNNSESKLVDTEEAFWRYLGFARLQTSLLQPMSGRLSKPYSFVDKNRRAARDVCQSAAIGKVESSLISYCVLDTAVRLAVGIGVVVKEKIPVAINCQWEKRIECPL